MSDAIFDGIIDQMRFNERLLLTLADPLSALRTAQNITRAFSAAGRYFLTPAPRTPWSMRLSGPTKLAWQTVPFAEVRGVAKALGGTINEVVLTTLAGALGRYLEMKGERTDGLVIRAATPVNVRAEDEEETLGNRVSFMLVGLPVGEHDPLKRFEAIHAESRSLKDVGQAQGVDDLLRIMGLAPAPVHALLGRTLSVPNTLSNLVCTNVPGPLRPLYLMGHRMVEHYPWVPLGWRMGIGVALMSYDSEIYFAFSGDRHAPDDVHLLAPYLGDAFRELREAAGVPAAAAKAPAPAKERAPAVSSARARRYSRRRARPARGSAA
jgi:WS/DGAT/MGAT family acyltransferase